MALSAPRRHRSGRRPYPGPVGGARIMVLTAPRLWLVAALAAAAVFTALPGLDLWVSGLFWTPERGFFLHDWPPFHWAYTALPALTWAIVTALLALLAFVIL